MQNIQLNWKQSSAKYAWKMRNYNFIICLATTALWVLATDGGALRRNSICSWMFYRNSTCSRFNFLCDNEKCIDRHRRCDGRYDCEDTSDEEYCEGSSSCPGRMKRCSEHYRCIVREWVCDGIKDCNGGSDENHCGEIGDKALRARARAVQWLHEQKTSSYGTELWGSRVDKSAVLLYLAGNTTGNSSLDTRKEMAYEVSIQLLSRLAKKNMKDIPSSDLASFLNAFLVTCIDPTNFYGLDIVQELRSRVDSQNYTNPYLLLSLCNAGVAITEVDKQKLVYSFGNKRRESWTDVQAVAVMALACANQQQGNDVYRKILHEMTLELKQLQYRNGTVENLQTTALVIQALLSAESEVDPDNFDDAKAMQHILAMQEDDGSFGSFQNAYYVLPVLNCNSLINVSSDHCEYSKKDEKSALYDLAQIPGPKARVHYSLWIGDERNLERNLVLRVPANTSFYRVMQLTADIDFRFRFEYLVKNRKPYVTAISGYQDDPESATSWFLYSIVEGNRTLSMQSPADIAVKDNDHFVMWYRSEKIGLEKDEL